MMTTEMFIKQAKVETKYEYIIYFRALERYKYKGFVKSYAYM